MQHEQMLAIIKSSGLEIVYAFEHTRRYGISLCIDGKYQNDVLVFYQEAYDAVCHT